MCAPLVSTLITQIRVAKMSIRSGENNHPDAEGYPVYKPKLTINAHDNWIMSIAVRKIDKPQIVTSNSEAVPSFASQHYMIVTTSRDHTAKAWNLHCNDRPRFRRMSSRFVRTFLGHTNCVSDVSIDRTGEFVVTSSYDGSLRLFKTSTGETVHRFGDKHSKVHTKDVLSVDFSPDDRLIVSGSRDKSIKIWNVLGECKYSWDDAHDQWVSCVRFVRNFEKHSCPQLLSAGWDKKVRLWSLDDDKHQFSTMKGHTGIVNSLDVAPDGTRSASADSEYIFIWDWEKLKYWQIIHAGGFVTCVKFHPTIDELVAAAIGADIYFYRTDFMNLKNKKRPLVEVINHQYLGKAYNKGLVATSLSWSPCGNEIFVGYSDGKVRVFEDIFIKS